MEVKCKICGYETTRRGLMPHVSQKHEMGLEDYVAKYGEYRKRQSNLITRAKDGEIVCKVCNAKCASERHLSYHLKMSHDLKRRDYITKYLLNDNIPLCKCGCGEQVSIRSSGKPPYWSEYISGHNIYDAHVGSKRSHESKMKMRQAAINRMKEKNSVFFYNAVSRQELDFAQWLREELNQIVVSSDKSVLFGLELDMYLPENNLAIEINGIRFHSDMYKDRNYHLKKTKECNEKGIRLIHIWSCDLLNKEDIIKSQVRHILGLSQNKVYARDCEIKEVSINDCHVFLRKNHLQGSVVSKHRYGLYHNNELVQIITFGKMRYAKRENEHTNAFELLRLCSKLNTTVVGGSSKLFNHFIKLHNPNYVLSYANRDWSMGSVYNLLNMKEAGYTPPGYFYSNGKAKLTRYQCQKHKLVEMGFDKEMSEYDIMQSRGYYKVWDCGNIKYELKLNQ